MGAALLRDHGSALLPGMCSCVRVDLCICTDPLYIHTCRKLSPHNKLGGSKNTSALFAPEHCSGQNISPPAAGETLDHCHPTPSRIGGARQDAGKRVRALASLAHTESLSPTQMQLERIIQLSKRYEKKEMRQMTRVDEELSSALLVCACVCVHVRVHACICLLRGKKGSNVFASPRTPAIQHLPVWWGASGRGSSAHARLRSLV